MKGLTLQLWRDIEYQKARGTLSPEQLVMKLKELARIYIQEEEFYLASDIYRELGDKDNLRQLSQVCMEKSYLSLAALILFNYLQDRNGLLRVMRAAEAKKDRELIEETAADYFGQERMQALDDNFKQWTISKGFPDAIPISSSDSVNMAYHLAPEYDVGVGIAKAGLYFTYVCTLFDLNTKIVECHRVKKGEIFRWCDKVSPDELEGKKIVVLENDVQTGRTAQRVLSELQKYNPSSIDLALIHSPVPPPGMFGTIQENIPPRYERIYFPKDFSYAAFDKTVELLEQRLPYSQKDPQKE